MKTLRLACRITSEERDLLAEQHLRALGEIDTLEEERASWKGRLTAAKDLEKTVREVLKTGEEWRDVECTEEVRGTSMVTVRTDTGAVVDTRPATAEERQVGMFEDVPPHEELKALAQEITGPKRKGRKARVTVVHVPENARQ